jgi:hypothetical protein
VGRVDAATRALRAHEVEGAGAFGVDRRATRSAAEQLARAGDQLRACGKDTRARVAAAAARRGHEACRAWSEEPGCAKALARLGGDEESRAKKRKRGKETRDDSADAPSKESGSDENDHIFFEDDRAGEQETLELNPAERRALAEDVHARVGAGGSRAADAVRTAVARAGRRAAEEAAERARDALLAASAQCCARDRPLASAPPDALQRASEAIEFLLFNPVGQTAASGQRRGLRAFRKKGGGARKRERFDSFFARGADARARDRPDALRAAAGRRRLELREPRDGARNGELGRRRRARSRGERGERG